MYPISFSASLKSDDVTIQSRKGRKIVPKQAYIVELKKNGNDLKSLYNLSLLWDKEGKNLVPYLLSDFIKDIDEKPDVNDEHCFALTLQDSDFENIKPEKILGVSLFSEEDIENEINWLQVQPKNNSIFEPANREYEDVGTAIVDYLKAQYAGKSMYANVSAGAIDFYRKQGFKSYDKKFPCSMYFKV